MVLVRLLCLALSALFFTRAVVLAGPTIHKPSVKKVVTNYYNASFYTEGPVFDSNGKFYFVSPTLESPDLFGGGVLTANVNEDKPKASVVVEPRIGGNNGMPNGATADQNGNIWIADFRLGVLKMTSDGKLQQIRTRDTSNETIQGINDVAFDYDGILWMTAPVGKLAPHPWYNGLDMRPSGCIYSYVPKLDKLTKLDDGYHYSNGIIVQHSADGKPKTLIVAEFFNKTLWSYDITGPGEIDLKSKRVWGSYPGDHWGGFDGIDFDEKGNLLVTNLGSGHIEVFGPNGGEIIGRIQLPFVNVTNLEFKPGTNEVYVSEVDYWEGKRMGIWTFKWINKGMKLYRDMKKTTSGATSLFHSLWTITLGVSTAYVSPFCTW